MNLVLDDTVVATLMRTPGHDVELADDLSEDVDDLGMLQLALAEDLNVEGGDEELVAAVEEQRRRRDQGERGGPQERAR